MLHLEFLHSKYLSAILQLKCLFLSFATEFVTPGILKLIVWSAVLLLLNFCCVTPLYCRNSIEHIQLFNSNAISSKFYVPDPFPHEAGLRMTKPLGVFGKKIDATVGDRRVLTFLYSKTRALVIPSAARDKHFYFWWNSHPERSEGSQTLLICFYW